MNIGNNKSRSAASSAPRVGSVKGGVRVDSFAKIMHVPIQSPTAYIGEVELASTNSKYRNKHNNMFKNLEDNKPLLYDEMCGC